MAGGGAAARVGQNKFVGQKNAAKDEK